MMTNDQFSAALKTSITEECKEEYGEHYSIGRSRACIEMAYERVLDGLREGADPMDMRVALLNVRMCLEARVK